MILCADDYGISPGVNRGIRELLEARRLSATSCMVVFPDSETDLRALRAYHGSIDIGLHLVMTDHTPLSPLAGDSGLRGQGDRFPAFSVLARRAYRGQLDVAGLSLELVAQMERFVELLGFPPDFVDGHQHVQQLPGIRTAIAKVLRKDHRLHDVYVRVGSRPSLTRAKALSSPSWSTLCGGYGIALPSVGARRLFRRSGVPTNRYLLGYYPSNQGLAFGDVIAWYASQSPSTRDVFFCHPGCVDPILGTRDPITDAREDVLTFLGSATFGQVLQEGQMVINRFAQAQPSGES